MPEVVVRDAGREDVLHVEAAAALIRAASERHAIVPRDPAFLRDKVELGRAAVALEEGRLVGFGYWSAWEDGKFVSHSGLVVAPGYRGLGLGRKLKMCLFESSRRDLPDANLMSLTTSPAVEALNLSLGFREVPLEELTKDPAFWAGCEPCPDLPGARAEGRLCCCKGFVRPPFASDEETRT